MNKLNLIGRKLTLLFAFIFLTFSDTLSAQTCPDVTRTVTNAKSTNSNKWDDIGMIMSNLLTGPSDASWLFETGASLQEKGDGTATLTGTLKLFGDATPARRFDVVLNLTGRTYTTPAGGAYDNTGVPTTSWYYYPNFTGTLKGKDGLAGSQLSVSLFMHAFQVGIGADQIFDSQEDYTLNGGAAWFSWKIISQPTDASIVLHDYVQGFSEADFAFLLSGTPTPKCDNGGGNTCGASAGTVALTATTVTLQNGAASIQGQPTADSKIPAGYFSTYVLTKGDNLTIVGANPTNYFTVNSAGTYRVHVLIFDPTTLDLSKIQFGTTTAAQINALLQQGGGTICGSLNLTGSKVIIVDNCTVSFVETSKPGDITIQAACGQTTAIATWIAPTATATCGTSTVTSNFKSGDVFPIGTTTVTYTATINGQTITYSFKVTVTNVQSTLIFDSTTKPVDISLQAACGKTTAIATWTSPKTISTCGTPTVSSNYKPGDAFAIGTTTVTYTATLNGQTVTCSFKVTVTGDTQAPVITCPVNMTKTPTNNLTCWTSFTWADATATDNCGATVTQISGPKSGSCIGYGVSTVTYKAVDAAGNSASCSFTITVNKPTCGVDKNFTGYMFLGSYNGNDYYKYIKTGDPNYVSALTLCSAIGGRLPIIKDAGQNTFLAGKLGTGNCWLGLTRSESKWKCSDGTFAGSYFHWAEGEPNNYGGIEDCVQMYSNGTWNDMAATGTNWCIVEIPCGGVVPNPCDNDVTPPTIVCPANMMKTPTNNVTCWTSFTWSDATAKDDCSTPTVIQTAGPKSGSCIGYGVSTVTYKATDAKGNFATCSFTITVNKPTPDIDPTKCYKVVNRHSGKCLETNRGSYSAPANCVQNDYSGNNCQKWNFTPTSNGCYKLQNVQSGKYLACNNNYNGAQVCQNNYDNDGHCDWNVIKNDNGSHTYKNRFCGRVADISGASKDKGASCISYDSKGTDNQEWDIVEVEVPKTSNCGWYCYHAQSAKIFEASAAAEANRTRVDFTNNLGYEVDYFTVQKLNVATSAFETVEILNNKVSDNSLQSYSVYDARPTQGDNFYRVEITNLDGQKSTSELLKANFSKVAGVNVYPNPAVDYIEVDMREYAGSDMKMTLFNQIGVQVMTHTIDKVQAGTTEHFDLSTLNNGQYFLRVTSKDKRDVTKAINIQK